MFCIYYNLCTVAQFKTYLFFYTQLTFLSINIRFLYVQLVVGMVKLYLNTVGNVLVKDVYVLRKISKLKFPLELTQAVFLELLERVMLDREGMLLNFDCRICNPHLVNH
jgi:hypothetical protein